MALKTAVLNKFFAGFQNFFKSNKNWAGGGGLFDKECS